MDGMAKHAQETAAAPRPRSRADIWFVLVLTGCASAFLQMWHATHSGSTAAVVDAVVGLVPAATAIGLSHAVVSHKAAAWLRVITVAVMLAFMAAAASASSAVVQPVELRDFNWVFSLALDAAELACVWMLLGSSERKAAEAAAVEAARREAAEAGKAVTEAVGKATSLEAELASVSAELVTANATVEALREAAQQPLTKRPRKPRKGARVSGDTEDLTAELRAMQMLDAHPELRAKGQGSELGRRLGVSPATGRRLHASLTSEEHPPEHPGPAAHEHPAQAADERPDEHTEG